MTLYKQNVNDVKTKKTTDVVTEDDEYEVYWDDPKINSDTVCLTPSVEEQIIVQQRRSVFIKCCVIFLTVISFVLVSVGTIYIWLHITATEDGKPFKESVRIRYHQWKTGANGEEKSFLMEGEFYQQVEIDLNHKKYEKLNVPSVLNSRPVTVLHDFYMKLTVIVDRDHGRCFIVPLNTTLVKPLGDFYDIVTQIKGGYYLPDGEVIRDEYRVLMPAVTDVSQFGPNIKSDCQFFDTYRLSRQDEPLAISKRSVCYFEGEIYCLGNAGSEFVPFITLTDCIND